MLLTPVCAFFFSSLLYFISHMLLELQHDACCSCVLPLSLLFKLFSMLTTPFCCPFSYTLTECCVFPSFTASHLLQPSCSSFCQQSFIIPFIVIHLCFSHCSSPYSHSSFICPCILFCSHCCLCLPFHFCSSCNQCFLFYY